MNYNIEEKRLEVRCATLRSQPESILQIKQVSLALFEMNDKNLQTTFFHVIDKKLDAWNHEKNKFAFSLSDEFWLMHLNFEHFTQHFHSTTEDQEKKASTFLSDIRNVKSKIVHRYSNLFEKDFSNYINKIIFDIYTDVLFYKNKDFEDFFELISKKHGFSDDKLLVKIVCFVKFIIYLHFEIEKINHLYHKEFQPLKFNTFLEQLKKFVNNFSQNDLISNDCLLLANFEKKLINLKKLIKSLTLDFNESDYLQAIALLDKYNETYKDLCATFKKYLYNFCYMADGSFNHEIILIFLFGVYDFHEVGTYLQTVVKKHENFFRSRYCELKSEYQNIDAILGIYTNECPSAITDSYYCTLPPFTVSNDPRFLLFKLQQLIALSNFYYTIKKISSTPYVTSIMNSYTLILKETRFMAISPNFVYDDFLSYTLNLFGLTQTDLAKILGVGNHNITREKQNNSLITKHECFFQATTGFTKTYIYGQTTIPNYGKTDNTDEIYGTQVLIQMTYAEMFLNYIDAITNYKKSLQEDECNTKTIYAINKKFNLEISEKVQDLMRKIQEKREVISDLYKFSQNLNGSEESKKVRQVSNLLLNNLIELMNCCIRLFEYPAMDYQKIHSKDLIEAKKKLKKYEKNRNDAINIDVVDEKIQNITDFYNKTLENTLQIILKEQKLFLEELKKKFESLNFFV